MGYSVSLIDGHIDEPKLTDEDVIKALECCIPRDISSCKNCPLWDVTTIGKSVWNDEWCDTRLLKNALDLINRKNTEINMLIRKKEVLRDEIYELQSEIERLKEIEYMYKNLLK